MSILKKLDKIPPPYSTIIALVLVSMVGLFFILWEDETRVLGFGIVAGGFLSVVFRAILEASGDELWQRIRKVFGGKRDASSD